MKLIKKKMTLEEYKKKYPHYRGNLLSFSDKEIKDINSDFRKYNENKENIDLDKYFLLKNRKWVHIDGRYYQVPGFSLTGFKSLNGAAKVGLSLGGAAVIAAAVVTPFFIPKGDAGPVTKEVFSNAMSYFTTQNADRKYSLDGITRSTFILENNEEEEPDVTYIKELSVSGYNEKYFYGNENEETGEIEYETEYYHKDVSADDVFVYDEEEKAWEYGNGDLMPSENLGFTLNIFNKNPELYTFNGKTATANNIVVQDVTLPYPEMEGIKCNATINNTVFTFDSNNNLEKIHEEILFEIPEYEEMKIKMVDDYNFTKVKTATVVLPDEEYPVEPVTEGIGYIGFDYNDNITTNKLSIDHYKIYCNASNRSNWQPKDGILTIPEKYKGEDVRGVYYDADKKLGGFENCSKLETVVHQGNYSISLEKNAFRNCPNLTTYCEDEVTSSNEGYFDFNNVDYVGENAFDGSLNNDLIGLLLGSGSTVFDCLAFGNDYSNTKVFTKTDDNGGYYLNNCIRYSEPEYEPYILIGGSVVDGKLDISDVSTCSAIADNAYKNNTEITVIADISNVERIGANAFNGCTNLQSVNWPDELRIIDEYAFANSGIKNPDFSKLIELRYIKDYAFYNCNNITSVTMPYLIYDMGLAIFGNESKVTLKEAKFVKDVEYRVYDDNYNYYVVDPSSEPEDAIKYLTGNYSWYCGVSGDELKFSSTNKNYVFGNNYSGSIYAGANYLNAYLKTYESEQNDEEVLASIKGFEILEEGGAVSPSTFANYLVLINGEVVNYTIEGNWIVLPTEVIETEKAGDVISLIIYNNEENYYKMTVKTF